MPQETTTAAPQAVNTDIGEELSSVFADIESSATPDNPQPPKPPEASSKPNTSSQPKASAKPAEKKSTEAPSEKAKESDTSTVTTKPEEKPVENPAEKPIERMAPKELRGAYESAKAELKKLRSELETVRSKPAEAPKPQADPEREVIVKERDQLAERLKTLEDEIRFVNYEKSSEYLDRYHKPYVETSQNAVAAISELTVENPDGSTRQATGDDLWRVVSTANTEKALKVAEELFGNPTKANYVMQWREQIRAAHIKSEKAKEEFRTKGTERERQMQEQSQREQQERAEMWKKLNESAVEQYPHWFKPEEGDEKGNALLERGFKLADQAFSGDPDMDPERQIALHSAVRNKAAAFDRVAWKLGESKKRITELEAKLAEYERSEPGKGEHRADAGDGEKTFEQLIDEMASPGNA